MLPPASPNPDVGSRRWHKTSFLKSALPLNADSLSLSEISALTSNSPGNTLSSTSGDRHTFANQRIIDPETDAHIEGILATEASMIVLDTLEVIVQVFMRLMVFMLLFLFLRARIKIFSSKTRSSLTRTTPRGYWPPSSASSFTPCPRTSPPSSSSTSSLSSALSFSNFPGFCLTRLRSTARISASSSSSTAPAQSRQYGRRHRPVSTC